MFIQDRFNIIINEQLKIRKKEIKFTIGMIVTHSPDLCLSSFERINTHDCVIIGWHYKCKFAFVYNNLSEFYENQHSYNLCSYQTCKIRQF